jgi:hypothetical protein
MRVLAIDASLRNTGVAIVDANNGKPRSLYFGTIHNASSIRSSACLVAIRDRLIELIREHEPDCCAFESVIYVQSYKTAILLGLHGERRFWLRRKMDSPFLNTRPVVSNRRLWVGARLGKIRSRSWCVRFLFDRDTGCRCG